MQAAKTIIELPQDVAEEMRAHVSPGLYESEVDVVREGLRALRERDEALDAWLWREVRPAYEALLADPTRALSLDDVRSDLKAGREKRSVT